MMSYVSPESDLYNANHSVPIITLHTYFLQKIMLEIVDKNGMKSFIVLKTFRHVRERSLPQEFQ